jgi:hypothetical protein
MRRFGIHNQNGVEEIDIEARLNSRKHGLKKR